MRLVRALVWLLALLPAGAGFLWMWFASRLPEPWADRIALREVTPCWDFADWATLVGEPAHVGLRLLHLGALQLPGASLASVTWVNALLALVVAVLLVDLLRATFAFGGLAPAVALAVAGFLVASPAAGATWLYGERAGVLLPPLLLLLALRWLHGERRVLLRQGGALLLAAAAPFCHTHGILVFLALAPAVLAASRHAGSSRGPAWLGTLLVAGNVAAVLSLAGGRGVTADGAAWFDRLQHDVGPTLHGLLERTGAAWFDVLPAHDGDGAVLGGLTWILLLLLPWIGDRSGVARWRAAPWWSCAWFGLLVIVWNTLRYDQAPPVGSWREADFGAFLLPVGLVGVMAARGGAGLLRFAGGALLVLALQDWATGLEELRRARLRVLTGEAAVLLPEALGGGAPGSLPVRTAEQLERLRARGQAPAGDADAAAAVAAALRAEPAARLGGCDGGDADGLRGRVVYSLRHDPAVWLVVAAVRDGDAGAPVLAAGPPGPVGRDRATAWQHRWRLPWTTLPAAGERVRVLGYLARERRLVPLGPVFVWRDGALHAEGGA